MMIQESQTNAKQQQQQQQQGNKVRNGTGGGTVSSSSNNRASWSFNTSTKNTKNCIRSRNNSPSRIIMIINFIMISLIFIVIISLLQIILQLQQQQRMNKNHNNINQSLISSSLSSSSSTSKSYLIEALSEFTKPQSNYKSAPLHNSNSNDIPRDDNPLLQVITDAGVSISDTNLTNQLLHVVYEGMKVQYGTNLHTPIIHGLERCSTYQEQVPYQDRIIAVAGMFNTGTNAMEYHLRTNLKMIHSLWQVPWGKHRMPYVTRLQHIASGMEKVRQQNVLPIIMIRDPYHWMQSMCKSQYAAHWKKTRLHCPNLVPTIHDIEKFHKDGIRTSTDTFNVTVNFDINQIFHWESLIHLYNDYYIQYYKNATYPRLIIRFEDMLIHAPTIIRMIGNCVVGIDDNSTLSLQQKPFQYQIKSAKDHGSHTDFVKAILKSGDHNARIRNMTTDDIQFAIKYLDSELMNVMHYNMPKV